MNIRTTAGPSAENSSRSTASAPPAGRRSNAGRLSTSKSDAYRTASTGNFSAIFVAKSRNHIPAIREDIDARIANSDTKETSRKGGKHGSEDIWRD